MRKVVLVICLFAGGCVSPTSPSQVCSTQPRLYTNPSTGVSQYEVDHYTAASCPAEPIR